MSFFSLQRPPRAAGFGFALRWQKDFAAGLLFLLIGTAWAGASFEYRIGKATAMGPGYFPLAVSLFLAALGAASIVRSQRVAEADPVGALPARTLLFIIAGVVGFGLLLENLGLLAAGAVLLSVSCWSRWRTRPVETLVLTAGLLALVIGVFVYGLNLPVSVF